MVVLRYGNNSSLELEFANGAAPRELGIPRGTPLADLAAATAAALREPIDYPALARCTTPGDRVVVALDRGLPQVAEVTAAVVGELINGGVDPDGITVLQSQSDHDAGVGDPRRLMPSALRQRIALIVHDPADRKELAYLAADKDGKPILINRALHEADLVLPVGCLRGERSAGYFDIHGVIYPTFSDVKTLQRFRSIGTLNGQGSRQRELTADVDNVAWLLGIMLTVQLVPAAGEQVLHVLAGQSDAVRQRGRDAYRAAWNWSVERQANLVVAAIEGGAGQQTWENLGLCAPLRRPLRRRRRAPLPSVAIYRPRPARRCGILAGEASRAAALHHLAKKRPVDTLPAAQLAHALDRNRVYLLSRLEAAVVEDLDMTPIESPDELLRLAHRHPSCILLSNAPNVTIAEDVI